MNTPAHIGSLYEFIPHMAGYGSCSYDKAGFRKCPYHNSLACIEMIKRLSTHSS